jgi:hypothetical protein
MALECGAIQLGRVSLDGTKLKANASKHKAMSYGRMKEKQQQLKEEVKQLLAAAEAADEEEDASTAASAATSCRRNCGGARLGWPRSRRPRKSWSNGRGTRPRRKVRVPQRQQAKPEDKDQYNFTDPESRIMKGADGMVQATMRRRRWNRELLLIVGQSVTEAANDKQQLVPMVELIEQQSGQRPEAILADNGYCSEQNLEHLESAEQPERKIEGFIATGKQKHGEHRLPAKRGPLAERRDQGGPDETEAANQGG